MAQRRLDRHADEMRRVQIQRFADPPQRMQVRFRFSLPEGLDEGLGNAGLGGELGGRDLIPLQDGGEGLGEVTVIRPSCGVGIMSGKG